MAAQGSPRMIEEERESPTPLLEVLKRSYSRPGGGRCSGATLRQIGFCGSSHVAHSGKVAHPAPVLVNGSGSVPLRPSRGMLAWVGCSGV
jgi:hypothetical protein